MKRLINTDRLVVVALTGFILGFVPAMAVYPQASSSETAYQEAREALSAIEKVVEHASDPQAKADAERAKQAVKRLLAALGDSTDAESDSAEQPADPYDGGKSYPNSARVSIESFNVPVDTREVHVPVRLDRESPNTVIAHIRVYDGKGGRADPDKKKSVIFRPGDPLERTVSFRVKNMDEGNNVRAVQYEVPDGGKRQGGGIRITAKAGAVNEPIENGREPTRFEPVGDLVFDVTGQNIKFDDQGSTDTFSTALSHGRTQVGNAETGYYGTVDMGGLQRTDEGLVLETRRLEEPVRIGTPAVEYPFLAVMLSGHRTKDTHFKYGSVEWVAKMPNRRYSWPALWLLPTGGWPPEIDVYEGFGYNQSWDFKSQLSTNLHGGDKLVRTFTRPAMRMRMDTFDQPNTLDSDFHTFAVTVTPEWITMFVNDVETMKYANPFRGETWYPLTNVAVKAPVDGSYDDGSGAMVLKSLKVWRSDE
jgi:hypothetical protein